MKNRRLLLMVISFLCPFMAVAQQYNGTSGLIHVPSAEMNHEGDVRFGSHFMNKAMTPDTGFIFNGEKYNTFDYYLSITPYNWIELSYTCTERLISRPGDAAVVYGAKDRYFSAKVQPLKEGKYYPAVAIGCNDVATTIYNPNNTSAQLYFTNYYLAATKHLCFSGNELGVTLAYRHYFRGYNAKWNGLVGGLTFRPSFFPQARAIVEYTGNEVQVGVDALLWRHLLIQASLKDFKYPNFGLCFQMNLLGKKYSY